MPTKHVSADKMGVGKKSSGKHWTAAEVEARQVASEGVKRKTPIALRVPEWLDDDARKVWYRVLRQMRGIELLDCLDGDMLAIYCDAVSKYRALSKGMVQVVDDEEEPVAREERIKILQSWARLVAGYAEKLGFTPAARARLVKKKADEILDEFGSEFDG
jgi:P27 family predicted phage terminase small subunit